MAALPTDTPPDMPPPGRRIVDPEAGAAGRVLAGKAERIVFVLAVVFSSFQIYTAAFSPLSSIVQRSMHVAFLLLLIYLLFGFQQHAERRHVPWYDWLLAATGFGLGFYHWVFEGDLILRAGNPSAIDLTVGCMVLVLVFEAARRVMGLALPILVGVFIPYALLGPHLPGFLMHRGYGFDQVVDQLYIGTEGIYGVPTFVSATYIFLFILFGSFLERAGMIRLFNDVALGTVGHAQGGPAKVSVISSGLMGTINGSGVANVLTTGQFTIPLMMRFGYRPTFAGAVEATSSMGGQIMPPVMGAVAFIMAETLGVPYTQIALAAIIPAVLYFVSAFWMVHLEAGREKLVGLPKEECPNALQSLKERWHLVLPLGMLVYLLFSGYTPLFAGTVGLLLTAVLILGTQLSAFGRGTMLRIVFWVVLGLLAAGLYRIGGLRIESTAFALVGLLVAASLLLPRTRPGIGLLLVSMAEGAKSALGVGIACALVGILIGIATMTGLASDLTRMIIALAGDNLLLALFLTMIACLVLGTGVPTIPNYIITSAMAAPALLELGVPLIVSHMFVFYFGIMADLTPPVALAALAASSIAKVSHIRIAFTATKIALAGYVVPFMAVYAPALMLQPMTVGGSVDPLAVIYILFKALVSIALWGAGAMGWLLGRLNWPERLVVTIAAFMLVLALPITDEIGLGLAASFMVWHLWRSGHLRRLRRQG